MTHIQCIPSFVALALVGGVFACTGATTPTTEDSEDELRRRKDSGAVASDAAADSGDAYGEICGGPPPNAFCAPCPDGSYGYKQIDGRPTCGCCSTPSTKDAGSTTCCDPSTKPPPGIEGLWCCGDGSWRYDIGSGNKKMTCGPYGESGTVCGAP